MFLTFIVGCLSAWLTLWFTLSHLPAAPSLAAWLVGLAATVHMGRLIRPRLADFPQDLSAYRLALPLAALAAVAIQMLLSLGFIADVQFGLKHGLPLTYAIACGLAVTTLGVAALWAPRNPRLSVLLLIAFLPGWFVGARLLDLPFRAATLPVLMGAFGQI